MNVAVWLIQQAVTMVTGNAGRSLDAFVVLALGGDVRAQGLSLADLGEGPRGLSPPFFFPVFSKCLTILL